MVDVVFTPELLACLRSDSLGLRVFDRHYTSGQSDWKARYFQEICHAELDPNI